MKANGRMRGARMAYVMPIRKIISIRAIASPYLYNGIFKY
jgi:hypothetical protein